MWIIDLNFKHLSWISASSAPKQRPHSFKVIWWSESASHWSKKSAIHGSMESKGALKGNSSWRETNLTEKRKPKHKCSSEKEDEKEKNTQSIYRSEGSLSKSQYFQITASTHLWAKSSWGLIECNFVCSDLKTIENKHF